MAEVLDQVGRFHGYKDDRESAMLAPGTGMAIRNLTDRMI